ncbi:unnamed protein product, partial [Brassica rapa subsp. narinosa]
MTKEELQKNKIDAAGFATIKVSHNLTERALFETTIPYAKDWREDGIVSPVRDQGQCDTAWAISAVGAVEAAYHQKHGIGTSLSEQQILECSKYHDHRCKGGFASNAFEYIRWYGLLPRAVYRYCGTTDPRICCSSGQMAWWPRVHIRSYDVGASGNENELKQWVGSKGPVVVGFHVTNSSAFYESGIYTSSECGNTIGELNHFMLVVGYGIEDGCVPYWLVQNSWGTD